MNRFEYPEIFTAYREYLGFSKSQLAREMGTTPTSISRWESGQETITLRTMRHLKIMVKERVRSQTLKVFAHLVPRLRLSKFVDLLGIPTTEVVEDQKGARYVGSITIGGHRKHSFHFSLASGELCALGRDRSSTPVTEEFLQLIIKEAAKKGS